MATKKKSTSSEGSSQFSIELGPHDLTDEEISTIGNEITKTIVDAVQRRATEAVAEFYVKILYVKQTHSKVVKQ
jgi:ribosomal protein L1